MLHGSVAAIRYLAHALLALLVGYVMTMLIEASWDRLCRHAIMPVSLLRPAG